MGRPPAYIFIVRHGNRLDAADKLWHLSSPTPYDPPLTYGGWQQCRALGQRIADILRENTPVDPSTAASSPRSSAESVASGQQPRPRKRRYKIAIHSSPFLRCIQTSIAISSGIASDTLPLESPRAFDPLPPLPQLPPTNNGPRLHKSVMRLDAFLGEWLSPSYFELITPPPSSVLMVASAKAELLRKENYDSFAHPTNNHTAHHHAHSHSTSQLWGSAQSSTWTRPLDAEEPSTATATAASPLLSPAARFGTTGADGRPLSSSGASMHMHSPALAGGYVAPVPHFALSSRAPTPTGYVAHARDACVDLDYQWDSMRAPYDWGDGGEFGEEWTAMHRRFRKGLQSLVDWYATSDSPTEMVTKTIHFKPKSTSTKTKKTHADGTVIDDAEFAIDSSDDDDDGADAGADDSDCVDESIVILVSHGAGCNALVGAITKEPVLMDVGLASLSVAARRPGRDEVPASRNTDDARCDAHTTRWTGAVHSGHPGGLVPLDKYYEMKMLANADHLRSVPTTPTTPRPNAMASVMGGGGTRGRHSNSLSGTPGNLSLFDNGVAGHRSSSAGSFHGASDLPMRRPSGVYARPVFSTSTSTLTRVASGGGPGGITIGSGVTTFSPPVPSISTSRLGRARAPSAGLWSPIGARGPEDESFGLTDGDDDGNDSDMEILLSFGPETTSPPPPAPLPPPAQASLPLPKKKAPSIKSTTSRNPSSLSIAHSANGDDDDNDHRTDYSAASSKMGSPVIRAAAENALDKAVRAGLPQLDIKAATSTGTSMSTTAAAPARSASPGLWAHPRVVSINGDELAHENALSKRRWTVTERPL